MLVQCLHRWPIIYTTLCERHFYYMERGIQPNLQRQLVYYDVTDGGRGRMSATDSQQKKVERTSEFYFFSKKNLISPNNGASEEAPFFFFFF